VTAFYVVSLVAHLCNQFGRSGIRTHGGVAPSLVFKTSALNRSATLPPISQIIASPSAACVPVPRPSQRPWEGRGGFPLAQGCPSSSADHPTRRRSSSISASCEAVWPPYAARRVARGNEAARLCVYRQANLLQRPWIPSSATTDRIRTQARLQV
jgi:hypothetical protein